MVNFHFSKTNDTEYLFLCLMGIYISSSLNGMLKSFAYLEKLHCLFP